MEPCSTSGSNTRVRVVRFAALAFVVGLSIANIGTCYLFRYSRNAGGAILDLNILAVVLGITCLPTFKRVSGRAPLDSYAITVIVGPTMAWGIDVFIMQGGRFFYH
jgi:hypothetical protein